MTAVALAVEANLVTGVPHVVRAIENAALAEVSAQARREVDRIDAAFDREYDHILDRLDRDDSALPDTLEVGRRGTLELIALLAGAFAFAFAMVGLMPHMLSAEVAAIAVVAADGVAALSMIGALAWYGREAPTNFAAPYRGFTAVTLVVTTVVAVVFALRQSPALILPWVAVVATLTVALFAGVSAVVARRRWAPVGVSLDWFDEVHRELTSEANATIQSTARASDEEWGAVIAQLTSAQRDEFMRLRDVGMRAYAARPDAISILSYDPGEPAGRQRYGAVEV